MTTIQFETAVDETRTETGTLDNKILVTDHESRPNFIINSDGTVDLESAKVPEIVVEGFGKNAKIVS